MVKIINTQKHFVKEAGFEWLSEHMLIRDSRVKQDPSPSQISTLISNQTQ